MKRYLKYVVFILFSIFSFYWTEKTAVLVRSKDPIMQSIRKYSLDNNYDAVDAKIENDYIVPGMYGKRVNEVKSLMNMKSSGVFNSLFLDFDMIKPKVSLEDNKDKIIIKGNEKKQAISLILEDDESELITYIISNKIPASLLVNKNSVNTNPYFEQINNDMENYSDVEKILSKGGINTNICVLGRGNKDLCLKNKKYLIKPGLVFSKSNMVTIKNNINSGDIILVKSNVSIDDMTYFINYVKGKGLKIVLLSELIKEN